MQRSKSITTAIASAALALTLAFPLSATASSAPSLDDEVSAALAAELQAVADASGGTVSFSDVTVDVSPQLVAAVGSQDADVIADYIVEEANLTAAAARPIDPVVPDSTIGARASQSYTADQSTAIPSFGIAWVNQDMTVNFTGNTVNSVKLNGNSYQTGISIFAYSHISTSTSYSKSRTCLNTLMKGTFSAAIKGSPFAFAASVLASDGPRGGKMVSINVNDC